MSFSEDPETSGNGGDLGFAPESSLKNTDPTVAVKTPNATAPANVPPGTEPAQQPTENTAVDPSVMGTAQDYQLARALDMLRGVAPFTGRASN